MLNYKGYIGSVEFSEEDNLFCGKVLGVKALISYEGSTAEELLSDFHNAVDDYLELCAAHKKEPEKCFMGTIDVRVSPELHRQAATYAMEHGETLNGFVENAIVAAMH